VPSCDCDGQARGLGIAVPPLQGGLDQIMDAVERGTGQLSSAPSPGARTGGATRSQRTV